MFRVAPGKALTTGRGVRGSGETISASDFRGDGVTRIADLLSRGLVVLDPTATKNSAPAGTESATLIGAAADITLSTPTPPEAPEPQSPPDTVSRPRGATRKSGPKK
jgi:hypothetical protein